MRILLRRSSVVGRRSSVVGRGSWVVGRRVDRQKVSVVAGLVLVGWSRVRERPRARTARTRTRAASAAVRHHDQPPPRHPGRARHPAPRAMRKSPLTGRTRLSQNVPRPPKSPRGAASVHGHTPGGRAAIGDDTQMVRRPTPIGRPGREAAGRPREEAPRPTRGYRPRRALPPRAREDGAQRGMTGVFPRSPPRHCTNRVIVRAALRLAASRPALPGRGGPLIPRSQPRWRCPPFD